MKAKLCSDSQAMDVFGSRPTLEGSMCSVLPGTGACSQSRRDHCVSLSAAVLPKA